MNLIKPTVLLWLGLFVLLSAQVFAQDDAGDAGDGGDEGGDDAEKKEGDDEQECEEAWDYLEFLKAEVKEKIEAILQEALFKPRPNLEETVTETMEKTLEVRDAILARTKAIRTNDGTVTICEGQNINQEAFLTQTRMDIMTVLLALIEKDAKTPEALQAIGKQLLDIRTSVNGMITQLIMLRTTLVRKVTSGECDCGILPDVVERLGVLVDEKEKEEDKAAGEDGDENAEGGENAEGKKADGEGDKIQDLTMILMDVDAEIRNLYNLILSELDEEKREDLQNKLLDHKELSNQMHTVISTKLITLKVQDDNDGIERVFKRDVRTIRNDAERLLKRCQEDCPSECDSCGAELVLELSQKLEDYKLNLEQTSEEDAKDSIRSDLMAYLTKTSSQMTDLLKQKAESEDSELPECEMQQLEVITKIKGPLWMMVNITIFGDSNTMLEMISALEIALTEMRQGYCGNTITTKIVEIETDECDQNEIETAKIWISDIDEVISNNLFKEDSPDARKNAMLGFIDLKASMDDRVRKLFQEGLQCKQEVEWIKNVYTTELTECLAELMNPRLRFELLDRTAKVSCIKNLRVKIEERRGELLMREILLRITEAQSQQEGGQ